MSDYIPARIPSSDFPSNVLKWMKLNNANPKMALKLMKCSKCFQHEMSPACNESCLYCPHTMHQRFPYFVVKNLKYNDPRKEWHFCTLDDKNHTLKGKESIENFTKKFWITEELTLFIFNQNISYLNLIPKIAACDIKCLKLHYQREIAYDIFKFLTASGMVEELDLTSTTIKYENGASVFIDTIFESVPNIKKFHHYGSDNIIPTNFHHICKDINITKLECLHIMIPYSSFTSFSLFMNQNPQIEYKLLFSDSSLSEKEKHRLEEYVQCIIDVGITKYPPPDIAFSGQSFEQSSALKSLIQNYNKTKNDYILNYFEQILCLLLIIGLKISF